MTLTLAASGWRVIDNLHAATSIGGVLEQPAFCELRMRAEARWQCILTCHEV